MRKARVMLPTKANVSWLILFDIKKSKANTPRKWRGEKTAIKA
jgi:hypothetical protein